MLVSNMETEADRRYAVVELRAKNPGPPRRYGLLKVGRPGGPRPLAWAATLEGLYDEVQPGAVE